MVPMRDGVRLAATICRPEGPGRVPVVLNRTPYGRSGMQRLWSAIVGHGYGFVTQDCRGRFDSEGEWVPFVNEPKDGFDTIEWIARQPWSNGSVVMVGGSYDGMVQWLAAKEHSPHLKGLMTFVTPSDMYEGFMHDGGSFLLGGGASWSVFVDGHKLNLGAMANSPWDKVFQTLPASEALGVLNRNPQYYRDWIAHPTEDSYWQAMNWASEIPKFDFPVLHLGGWFDIFQKGTIESFQRMTTRAAPSARGKQHLVMGPWAHQGQEKSLLGEVDFGAGSTLNLITWLPAYLGASDGAEKTAPVHLFTMGENQWRDYEAWPIPGTRYVDYYLGSAGRANTAGGDGRLETPKPAKAETSDSFIYDPASPVPTHGGGNCCWPEIVAWGPFDQHQIETRQDVLVYSTPPLDEPLRVTGAVVAKLWIASSAPDTDFTAKLIDVAPDGRAINLTDGVRRVAYRNSYRKPELLKPGTAAEITIDLWNTSNLFLKGHRIRLEVSSSNFPRYSRNLNTGNLPETEKEIRKATQTILHDAGHPSRLVLPVLGK